MEPQAEEKKWKEPNLDKHKAAVWKYFGFSLKDSKIVVCKLCKKDLTFTGGTTNLHKHIQRHHTDLARSKPDQGVPSTSTSSTTIAGI